MSPPAPAGHREDGERRPSRLNARLRGLPGADRGRVSFVPEEVLGPFSRLPPGDRDALRSAVEGYDAAVMRGYEGRAGRWHGHLLGLVARGAAGARGWRGPTRPLGRRLDRGLRNLMSAIRRAPEFAGEASFRTFHGLRSRLPDAGTAAVGGLLVRRGLSPHDLAVVYARPLAQRPPFRAFWRDPEAHRTVGCILGLDLCPGPDGWYVLECNLEPAQHPQHLQVSRPETLPTNLVRHAAAAGYGHLVVLDSRFSGVLPAMAEEYREAAAEAGLRVRLVDRIFVPQSANERSFGLPPDLPGDTLVARLKTYPVATDHLLQDKIGSHRALSLYADVADEPDLRVPSAGPEPVLADHDRESPFPNVVSKLADVDKGRAVRFAKARSPGHAREIFARSTGPDGGMLLRERIRNAVRESRHVFQEYVRPRLLEGRHPYKVRANVLVSPDGPVFLSAHRVVSRRSVPERLPLGLVEDRKLFSVSHSSGNGYYDRVPAGELSLVKRASLAAGRGLAWALRESFVWRPGQAEGTGRSRGGAGPRP